MHLQTTIKKSRTARGTGGFTLVEMMTAGGLSMLILAAIAASFIAASRNFASVGNYIDLNRNSLWAMDQMTRDVRQAVGLQSFATNQLVFVDNASNQTTFAWSPNTKKLVRTSGGNTTVLLEDCDYLTFDICQRTPKTDGTFGFYSATNNPAICKLVSVSWRCSRNVLGSTENSESMQMAKIVLRN